MPRTQNVATGLSAFVQAFSAVDAVGSRRRREKLLAERLEDEQAFRAQQIEFQQAGEDRAQTEFDETREQRQRRRAGDAVGLDPKSTDAQLREAAQDSVVAQQALLKRNQTAEGARVFGNIADQQLAARQIDAGVEGASGEETEQLSGLSQSVGAAKLPGDLSATRSVSRDEIRKQTGAAFTIAGAAGFKQSFDMPPDFMTLDEIKEFGKTDPTEAEAIRVRQQAELIESDPRDGTQVTDDREAKKAETQQLWGDFTDASNPAGDQWRRFVDKNPSAAVSVYFDARNSLDASTRRDTDKLMKPAVDLAKAEQRLVLDAEDADPTSQDTARAQRKYSRALAVDHAIITGFDPAKEAGIRSAGIPSGNEELGQSFSEQLQNGPRTEGMIAENKQRQIRSQLVRDHANPTRKASSQQLKNLYLGTQMGIITPQQAIWASWHGGQLPGAIPEHILVGKGQTLIAKTADGFKVISSPSDRDALDRKYNKFSAGSRAALTRHFSQFNTDDHKSRGTAYESDFLAFLGRTTAVASKLGIDLSSEIDLVQLANRYQQKAIFDKVYHEQFWEFGPDFVGDREDYAEHFDSFDAAVYGTKIDEFLQIKSGEIFNEFRDIRVDPIQGGGVDAAGFRKALELDNPQAAAQLNRQFPSDSALEAALVQQAQLEQQGQ
ncbi:hypothetical protein LCGC14_1508150 [marine sediment metagenome]|uniref:Uncharacterized protein n=1 Tax=marine sediment metagenome TaxID=412755 RepID=A0A0F9M3G5_9ZZZZ